MPMNISPAFAVTPVISTCQVTAANSVRGLALYACGLNNSGQLGDNTIVSKSSPISVVGSHYFIQVAAGTAHVSALKPDGSAWAWGANTSGNLGDNTVTSRSSPVSVVGNHRFSQLSQAGPTTIGLNSDGYVFGWGDNLSGQLGDNTATNRSSPVSVIGIHSFVQISAGLANSYGLKADGSAWAWGATTSGANGDNTATNRSSPVSVIGAHSFRTISAFQNGAACLKADGSAWAWGVNSSGTCGDNTATNRSSPVSVIGAHSFVQLVGGAFTTVTALKADGSCWTWGAASNGQLGDNQTVANRSSPVSVIGAHSFIAIGPSIGIKIDGSFWSWGLNGNGQLGDITTSSRSSPVSCVGFYFNSGAVSRVGTIYSLGISNQYSLLLTGSQSGTRVDSITVQATGITTAGSVRIFLHDGAGSITLLKEIPVAATIPADGIPAFTTTVNLGITLPFGDSLVATTNNSEPFNVIAMGAIF